MAKRTSFLIRIDPRLLDELKRWADAEFRSTNAQIEYLLRKSLADAGRLRRHGTNDSTTADRPEDSNTANEEDDASEDCNPDRESD